VADHIALVAGHIALVAGHIAQSPLGADHIVPGAILYGDVRTPLGEVHTVLEADHIVLVTNYIDLDGVRIPSPDVHFALVVVRTHLVGFAEASILPAAARSSERK